MDAAIFAEYLEKRYQHQVNYYEEVSMVIDHTFYAYYNFCCHAIGQIRFEICNSRECRFSYYSQFCFKDLPISGVMGKLSVHHWTIETGNILLLI